MITLEALALPLAVTGTYSAYEHPAAATPIPVGAGILTALTALAGRRHHNNT
ncbi:hypothetical protein [Streptomyces cacaoi]|uniref:hypothetical protein n=1 Tax=Streptomyces cacaoi TaxID=1898 RepID=UPI0016596652|nr:hypothetical protein [Streptomyces cacaoi]